MRARYGNSKPKEVSDVAYDKSYRTLARTFLVWIYRKMCLVSELYEGLISVTCFK